MPQPPAHTRHDRTPQAQQAHPIPSSIPARTISPSCTSHLNQFEFQRKSTLVGKLESDLSILQCQVADIEKNCDMWFKAIAEQINKNSIHTLKRCTKDFENQVACRFFAQEARLRALEESILSWSNQTLDKNISMLESKSETTILALNDDGVASSNTMTATSEKLRELDAKNSVPEQFDISTPCSWLQSADVRFASKFEELEAKVNNVALKNDVPEEALLESEHSKPKSDSELLNDGSLNVSIEEGKSVSESQSLLPEGRDPAALFATHKAARLDKTSGNIIGPMPLVITIQSTAGWRSGHAQLCCVAEVLGKKMSEFRTKAVSTEADAVWNESFEVAEFNMDDDLSFTVYDKYPGRSMQSSIVGTAKLTGREIFEGSSANSVKLSISEMYSGCATGLDLHLEIVKLNLSFQRVELRRVASLVQSTRALVEESLEDISNHMIKVVDDNAMHSLNSAIHVAEVKGTCALDIEIGQQKQLLHKLEENECQSTCDGPPTRENCAQTSL